MKRALLIIAFVLTSSAQDCASGTAIAVTSSPPADFRATTQSAFDVVTTVAGQFGMKSFPSEELHDDGVRVCFGEPERRAPVMVCGKTNGREVQFMLEQIRIGLSPHADSIRVALLDSLRTQFGAEHVRECRWQTDRDDPSKSGCPTLADSTTR